MRLKDSDHDEPDPGESTGATSGRSPASGTTAGGEWYRDSDWAEHAAVRDASANSGRSTVAHGPPAGLLRHQRLLPSHNCRTGRLVRVSVDGQHRLDCP